MAKETAEQKLLKIIEASGGAGAAAPKAAKPKPKTGKVFSIQRLNQLLIIGIVICVLALGWEIQHGLSFLQRDVDLSAEKMVPSRTVAAFVPLAKNLSYFTDKISSRNIFKPYEEKVQQAVSTGPVVSNLNKILSKYKLVGIAWLDLPESASIMIENKETGLTYFLREGEQLEGVTIKTIYTDRAVLSYENEEIIIKL